MYAFKESYLEIEGGTVCKIRSL